MIMQEKDMLQDLLVLEKDMMGTYSTFIMESSCTKERTVLNNNYKALAMDQYNVYDAMAKRGYYPTKNADPQEVAEAKTKMEGILKQLN